MSETRVRMHPTLGILVGSDGHVMVPQSGTHRAHWTYGFVNGRGYRQVGIKGKTYLVHRLVAEAFIPNPNCYKEVDHVNRDKSANSSANLRWASRKENEDNTDRVDASLAKYGVRACEDKTAYDREYYKKNPELAKRQNEYQRKRRATDPAYAERRRAKDRAYQRKRSAEKKAQGLTYRKGPDGKRGWFQKRSN